MLSQLYCPGAAAAEGLPNVAEGLPAGGRPELPGCSQLTHSHLGALTQRGWAAEPWATEGVGAGCSLSVSPHRAQLEGQERGKPSWVGAGPYQCCWCLYQLCLPASMNLSKVKALPYPSHQTYTSCCFCPCSPTRSTLALPPDRTSLRGLKLSLGLLKEQQGQLQGLKIGLVKTKVRIPGESDFPA